MKAGGQRGGEKRGEEWRDSKRQPARQIDRQTDRQTRDYERVRVGLGRTDSRLSPDSRTMGRILTDVQIHSAGRDDSDVCGRSRVLAVCT